MSPKMKSVINAVFSIFFMGILLHIMPSAPSVSAQAPTWITIEGTAPMANLSKKEARARAVNDAMRKAVRDVVGVHISVETLAINLRLSGGMIGVIPYGRVAASEILEESIVNVHIQGQKHPSLEYRVKMRAGVVEETGESDPSFRLKSSLNKTGFIDGDEMQIRIKSTNDCYIWVFIILEDEKVLRLIPNRFKKNNLLKADKAFFFPDENDKKMGISLKVHAPEGKDVTREMVYILALKQPQNWSVPGLQEGIYGEYDGKTSFMKEMIREIVHIPVDQRAETLLHYQISR